MSVVQWVHPQSLVPKTQPDLYTLADERRQAIGAFLAGDRAITRQLHEAERAGMARAATLVPTQWCDPLLTGPNGIDARERGLDCRVIEQLLRGIQDRIRAQAQGQEES